MKKFLVFAMALVCVVALAGCAGSGGTLEGGTDESGTYSVTANNAEKGSGVGSLGGGVEIAAGQLLVISPNIDKGSLQVRLLDEKGEVALDEAASGHAPSSHELTPGDYSIGVTTNENGTTGTLLIVAVDAAEYEKQNHDIDAILAQMGSGSSASADSSASASTSADSEK